MDSPIHFSFHDIDPESFPLDEKNVISWLEALLRSAQRPVQNLGFVFSNDEYILSLNRDYLKHDYYTDILTFPYDYSPVNAEIYISLDRVLDNSEKVGSPYTSEVLRVIAHGVLHMLGFDDHKEEDIKAMREAEEKWIKSFYEHYG